MSSQVPGLGRAVDDALAEVKRQDRFHPSGYPATRDGVFLGITTAVHELDREAIEAWREDRCKCPTPLCGHAKWQATRGEVIQSVAILLRLLRSIDEATTTTCQCLCHSLGGGFGMSHNSPCCDRQDQPLQVRAFDEPEGRK